MHKLLTALAAASALALCATAAQANCYENHVTASAAPSQEAVSMSTHDGDVVPPVAEEDAERAEAAAPPVCAEGDKDCVAGTE